MSSVKSFILVIVVVFGGWLLVKGAVTVVLEQRLKEDSPIKMSKQEYLDYAVPNCANNGLTTAQCKCFYSEMIDRKGVAETYRFDLSAISDNFEPSQEAINLVKKCVDAI